MLLTPVGPQAHVRLISAAPADTGAPTWTKTAATVPAVAARTSISIFIASSTASTVPGSTASPADTRISTTVASIGATGAPGVAPPVLDAVRARGESSPT